MALPLPWPQALRELPQACSNYGNKAPLGLRLCSNHGNQVPLPLSPQHGSLLVGCGHWGAMAGTGPGAIRGDEASVAAQAAASAHGCQHNAPTASD